MLPKDTVWDLERRSLIHKIIHLSTIRSSNLCRICFHSVERGWTKIPKIKLKMNKWIHYVMNMLKCSASRKEKHDTHDMIVGFQLRQSQKPIHFHSLGMSFIQNCSYCMFFAALFTVCKMMLSLDYDFSALNFAWIVFIWLFCTSEPLNMDCQFKINLNRFRKVNPHQN